jgi:hypothetical protein
MKKILFALSAFAVAAAATVPVTASAADPVCVTFSSYCDAMQYDSKKKATWHNYDCGGSAGKQTTAVYKAGKKGSTTCDGLSGCNPAYAYGWDSLDWTFNFVASTGTLTGMYAGTEYVLQQDMPIGVTAGACAVNRTKGGVSVLAH